MKVEQTKQFSPVIIALETQDEVDRLCGVLNHSDVNKITGVELHSELSKLQTARWRDYFNEFVYNLQVKYRPE